MKANNQQRKSQPQKKGKGAVNIRQATSSLSVYGRPNANNGGPVRTLPAAMGAVKVTGKPKINSVGKSGDTHIIHREYLGEVTVTSEFKALSYPINPGQQLTFPWLSLIAGRFESYKLNALRFCYETEASSQKSGTIALTIDYDPVDAPPVSKVAALAYRNSARAQPWLSFVQTSSKEDLSKQKTYFVRQVSTAPDLRVTDVGNLFVVTQGGDDTVCGELWVEYDVLLMTPQFNSAAGATLATDSYFRWTTGISSSAVFGAGSATAGTVTNDLGLTVAANDITFPAPGFYEILYWVNAVEASSPTVSLVPLSSPHVTYTFDDVYSDATPNQMALCMIYAQALQSGAKLAFTATGSFLGNAAALYVSACGNHWNQYLQDQILYALT